MSGAKVDRVLRQNLGGDLLGLGELAQAKPRFGQVDAAPLEAWPGMGLGARAMATSANIMWVFEKLVRIVCLHEHQTRYTGAVQGASH